MQKKILVTGGCGYIGSHVVRALSERQEKVVVIDDLSTGSTEALLHNESFYQGDIADHQLITRIFKDHPEIHSVLHFASKISVPESATDPLLYYASNVQKLVAFLTSLRNVSKVEKLIFSSTAAVYGTTPQERYTEEDAGSPANPYGMSKWMGENILQDVALQLGFRLGILRYFNVAGAALDARIGQQTSYASKHIIKMITENAAKGQFKIQIFGNDYPTPDGTCIRDYIHVLDLADVHIRTLDYLDQAEQACFLANCGYGVGVSVREVVECANRVLPQKIDVTLAPRRPGDAVSLVADCSLLFKTLQWKPQHAHLESMIETAFAWERRA